MAFCTRGRVPVSMQIGAVDPIRFFRLVGLRGLWSYSDLPTVRFVQSTLSPRVTAGECPDIMDEQTKRCFLRDTSGVCWSRLLWFDDGDALRSM